MASGTLYVVATPLGHLGDLTSRARDVLRAVPVVAAEDTRRTRRLLAHLDAHPRLLSCHAHSPAGRMAQLLRLLAEGRDIALVSDAGTPAISDPGAEVVAAVRQAGGRVVPIPGPSAVTAVLSAAGMSADRYLFLGFLPRRGPERRRLLEAAASSEWTVVLFEAPPRLSRLLEDLVAAAGPDRVALVAREVTKVHEELRSGPLADQLAFWRAAEPRGELTVILAGRGPRSRGTEAAEALEELPERIRTLRAKGCPAKEIVRMVTAEYAIPRNAAYRLVLETA